MASPIYSIGSMCVTAIVDAPVSSSVQLDADSGTQPVVNRDRDSHYGYNKGGEISVPHSPEPPSRVCEERHRSKRSALDWHTQLSAHVRSKRAHQPRMSEDAIHQGRFIWAARLSRRHKK